MKVSRNDVAHAQVYRVEYLNSWSSTEKRLLLFFYFFFFQNGCATANFLITRQRLTLCLGIPTFIGFKLDRQYPLFFISVGAFQWNNFPHGVRIHPLHLNTTERLSVVYFVYLLSSIFAKKKKQTNKTKTKKKKRIEQNEKEYCTVWHRHKLEWNFCKEYINISIIKW